MHASQKHSPRRSLSHSLTRTDIGIGPLFFRCGIGPHLQRHRSRLGDQRGLIAGHRLDGGANEVIVGASQHSGPIRRRREGEAVERQAEADTPTFDVCFLQRPMPKEAGASQSRREELQIGNLLRRKVPLRKLLEIEARIDALDVAANLHAAREYIERKRVGAGDVELNVARNDGKFAEFVEPVT